MILRNSRKLVDRAQHRTAAAVLTVLLALSLLHPYAALFAATGALIGFAVGGRGRLWIAAVLAPIGATWAFLATLAARGTLFGLPAQYLSMGLLVRIPLVWLAVLFGAAVLSIVSKRPRFIAAALLAISIQGAAVWYIARVSSRLAFGDLVPARFLVSAIEVIRRQGGDPRLAVYRLRYHGSGRVLSTHAALDEMFLNETLELDGRAARRLATYIAQFPEGVRCRDLLDCLHFSAPENDDLSNVTKTLRSDGGVTVRQKRHSSLAFAPLPRRDLVASILYRFSAVHPPALVSLPEGRILDNFLTLAPGSKLRLSVPANQVVSTEPPYVASAVAGREERFDFEVGFPRTPRLGLFDHLFMEGAGVHLTAVKPAFASPFWVTILRFIASPIGLWLLLSVTSVAAFLTVRARKPIVTASSNEDS